MTISAPTGTVYQPVPIKNLSDTVKVATGQMTPTEFRARRNEESAK